ncbi:MAG: Sec-independent protein translocase protein TatB [Hyphomicrobium sp.]
MFDISWSELLILAIVTLVFVGPKELPVFLRTLGRYAGTVRRHANDFKAQFDAAMREAELDSMRKEV